MARSPWACPSLSFTCLKLSMSNITNNFMFSGAIRPSSSVTCLWKARLLHTPESASIAASFSSLETRPSTGCVALFKMIIPIETKTRTQIDVIRYTDLFNWSFSFIILFIETEQTTLQPLEHWFDVTRYFLFIAEKLLSSTSREAVTSGSFFPISCFPEEYRICFSSLISRIVMPFSSSGYLNTLSNSLL